MNRKVLIINDCRFESMILKDMLEKINFIPILSNEEDGIIATIDKKPSVIIVNYIMKEIRGDRLAKKIKLIDPKIKCIISSCNELNREDYEEDFVDGTMITPIKPVQLVDILSELIA